MKNIYDVPYSHCNGCTCCYNICPTNAIVMKENDEGFLYPEIDFNKCIKCGLCYKSCPIENFSFVNTNEPSAYAMMAPDVIRNTSSSGGMFSMLANYIFQKNGVVCGVRNDGPFRLVFDFARNEQELEPLKASKYFQAEVADTYQKIKELLGKNIYVLFCACPCQVAGLKNFLGKDYKTLITADIICHGVPSYKFAEACSASLTPLNEIDKVKFRDKSVFKWSSNYKVIKKDGKSIDVSYNDSDFYKAFSKGLPMREGCYNCKFASIPRVGDFTLGDYWHITEFAPDMNDDMGTSCVLLNTDKAKEIYKEIEPVFKKSKELPLNTATKYNTQLRMPTLRNPNRNAFLKEINDGEPIKKVLEKFSAPKKYDVGITGYWYATNYGSVLTYYALYKAIENMGYSTVLLDRPDKHLDGEPLTVFSRKFMERFANISPSFKYKDAKRSYNNLCDKFVVGSDQVWTKDAIRICGYRFFLDFASDDKVRVAYAPSFGHNSFDVLPETKRIVSHLLSKFDAISVREDTAVKLCKEQLHVDAVQMIDPIFLNDREFYNTIADFSNVQENEPYVLSYILDPNDKKRGILTSVEEKLSAKLINILDGRYNTFGRNNALLNLPNTKENVMLEDWVKYFKNAKYVVTDSHHGLAMAVIFNKPFICIMNERRGATRFESLLSWLCLSDRLVSEDIDMASLDKYLADINFSHTNKIMAKKRNEALNWLKKSLKTKKELAPATTDDYVDSRLFELKAMIDKLTWENNELRKKLDDFINGKDKNND